MENIGKYVYIMYHYVPKQWEMDGSLGVFVVGRLLFLTHSAARMDTGGSLFWQTAKGSNPWNWWGPTQLSLSNSHYQSTLIFTGDYSHLYYNMYIYIYNYIYIISINIPHPHI